MKAIDTGDVVDAAVEMYKTLAKAYSAQMKELEARGSVIECTAAASVIAANVLALRLESVLRRSNTPPETLKRLHEIAKVMTEQIENARGPQPQAVAMA